MNAPALDRLQYNDITVTPVGEISGTPGFLSFFFISFGVAILLLAILDYYLSRKNHSPFSSTSILFISIAYATFLSPALLATFILPLEIEQRKGASLNLPETSMYMFAYILPLPLLFFSFKKWKKKGKSLNPINLQQRLCLIVIALLLLCVPSATEIYRKNSVPVDAILQSPKSEIDL